LSLSLPDAARRGPGHALPVCRVSACGEAVPWCRRQVGNVSVAEGCWCRTTAWCWCPATRRTA